MAGVSDVVTPEAMQRRIAKASLMDVMYAYLRYTVARQWLGWPLLVVGMTNEEWGEQVITLVTKCTERTRDDVLDDWSRIGNRHINHLATKLSAKEARQ